MSETGDPQPAQTAPAAPPSPASTPPSPASTPPEAASAPPAATPPPEVSAHEVRMVQVAPGVSYPAAPTRKRGRETAADMVRSMLVVGGVVLFLVLVVKRPQPDPVRTVDWIPTAQAAAAQSAFPVVAPAGLGADWRPTSARFEAVPKQATRTLWHLGFVTPAQAYAGLDQSDAEAAQFLSDATAKGRPDGSVVIAGTTWNRYSGGTNGYRALWRPWAGSTVVVAGSAQWPELTTLASSLQVFRAPAPATSAATPSG